ncbi:MAG: DUF2842 domain-containing protein [Alphaproteobacteria bacterium]|nr:DUF2842 domain-containing protein [Alphaproteobacteria bacterium]
MSGGAKRAVGSVVILVFLAIYVVAAVSIGERLAGAPPWATLLFYAIAGTAWGLPLKPLFDWMGKD